MCTGLNRSLSDKGSLFNGFMPDNLQSTKYLPYFIKVAYRWRSIIGQNSCFSCRLLLLQRGMSIQVGHSDTLVLEIGLGLKTIRARTIKNINTVLVQRHRFYTYRISIHRSYLCSREEND